METHFEIHSAHLVILFSLVHSASRSASATVAKLIAPGLSFLSRLPHIHTHTHTHAPLFDEQLHEDPGRIRFFPKPDRLSTIHTCTHRLQAHAHARADRGDDGDDNDNDVNGDDRDDDDDNNNSDNDNDDDDERDGGLHGQQDDIVACVESRTRAYTIPPRATDRPTSCVPRSPARDVKLARASRFFSVSFFFFSFVVLSSALGRKTVGGNVRRGEVATDSSRVETDALHPELCGPTGRIKPPKV